MNSSTEIIIKDQNYLNNQSGTDEPVEEKNNNSCMTCIHKQTLAKYFVFVLLSGYFIWATVHYIKYSDEAFGSTTCTGYGFLVILYFFYIYGLLYVLLLKPYVLPVIERSIWKPAANVLNNIKFGSTIFYVSLLVLTIAYLIFDTRDNRQRLMPLSGLLIFLLVGYIFSSNRTMINWRPVLWGLILQFTFGLVTIRWEVGRNILDCFGQKVNTMLNYAFEGASFAYGTTLVNKDAVFAFKALSTIYFISFMVNILYFYGIMQKIVGSIGQFLQWIMDTTICESVNSAANIFLGLTEAPIILAPYLKNLTDSELHSIMTSGFATVAGSVMAAYISFGARPQDLITSSIMSAPAALCFSKLMYPETEKVKVHRKNIEEVENEFDSVLDAACKGASNGIQMVHGIIASIIAFLASVYLINGVLGWCGQLVGYTDPIWSLELITGKIFIPISYLMGIPWSECENVATLIGLKTMVNEFVAFRNMKTMLDNGLLSPRTRVIATYAICGFSNPGSVGITISAFNTLVPNKKDVVARLIFRAFVGGAMVCFMTACIAGTLMPDDAVM